MTRGTVPGLILALKRSSGVDGMNMCSECSWLGTVRRSVELTGNTPAGPCMCIVFREYLKQNLNTTVLTLHRNNKSSLIYKFKMNRKTPL